MATTFNNYFLALVQPHPNTPRSANSTNVCPSVSEPCYLLPTTEKVIVTKLIKLKNNKVVNIDGIQVKSIRFVVDLIAFVLTHIFHLIYRTGIFPQNRQIANISVIHISDDINNLAHYIPISVLAVFSKDIEKIIHERLTSCLCEHSNFPT